MASRHIYSLSKSSKCFPLQHFQFHAGKNVGLGKDHTIFSLIDGVVKFEKFGPDRKKVSYLVTHLTILVWKSYAIPSDIHYGLLWSTGECISTRSTARESQQLQGKEERELQAATWTQENENRKHYCSIPDSTGFCCWRHRQPSHLLILKAGPPSKYSRFAYRFEPFISESLLSNICSYSHWEVQL